MLLIFRDGKWFQAHSRICEPFTRTEVDKGKIKLSNVYVLIDDLDIPEEKYFNSTKDTLQDIMEKLDLSDDEEPETLEEKKEQETLTLQLQSLRNIAYKRGLSDILKTKLI